MKTDDVTPRGDADEVPIGTPVPVIAKSSDATDEQMAKFEKMKMRAKAHLPSSAHPPPMHTFSLNCESRLGSPVLTSLPNLTRLRSRSIYQSSRARY